MRHPTQPPNHSRLLATVLGLLLCFAAYIAIEADRDNDTAIRIQMLTTRSQ